MNEFDKKTNLKIFKENILTKENPIVTNIRNIFTNDVKNILQNNIEKPKEINLDLAREIMLAKIFWLKAKDISKLSEDFKEPLTVSQVIWDMESYFRYIKNNPKQIAKNEILEVAV